MKNLGLVVLAALLAAVVVQCLIYIIDGLSWVCFLGQYSTTSPDISNTGLGAWMILIPVAGALAGVLLINTGKKWLTPLSAVIMTGTGFPFGVEGVLASGLFILGDRKLLRAAVIASGLACLLNVPLAAVVLVFELGFIELSFFNVLAMMLAAGTGACCRFILMGWVAILPVENVPGLKVDLVYACFVTGIIVSLFGCLMTWLIKKLEKIRLQRNWLPVAAAFIIGYLGWLWPEGLGTGHYFIPALSSGTINLQVLLGLSLVRLAMLVLAAGSGAPGKELMITPLLLIGATLGMASLLLVSMMVGIYDVTPELAAVVGIAALLTGRLPVIFAALIFSVELTHQWMVIIPAIAALIPAMLLRSVIVRNGTN
jgi:H+/Cl- antiporter ClcA